MKPILSVIVVTVFLASTSLSAQAEPSDAKAKRLACAHVADLAILALENINDHKKTLLDTHGWKHRRELKEDQSKEIRDFVLPRLELYKALECPVSALHFYMICEYVSGGKCKDRMEQRIQNVN